MLCVTFVPFFIKNAEKYVVNHSYLGLCQSMCVRVPVLKLNMASHRGYLNYGILADSWRLYFQSIKDPSCRSPMGNDPLEQSTIVNMKKSPTFLRIQSLSLFWEKKAIFSYLKRLSLPTCPIHTPRHNVTENYKAIFKNSFLPPSPPLPPPMSLMSLMSLMSMTLGYFRRLGLVTIYREIILQQLVTLFNTVLKVFQFPTFFLFNVCKLAVTIEGY